MGDIDGGMVGIGHQQGKLRADVPVRILPVIRFRRVEVYSTVLSVVVSLWEKKDAPIRGWNPSISKRQHNSPEQYQSKFTRYSMDCMP